MNLECMTKITDYGEFSNFYTDTQKIHVYINIHKNIPSEILHVFILDINSWLT